MRARGVLLALVAVAGCGDDLPRDPTVTGHGGTRLALMWLGFDDGARLLRPEQLYDRFEHAACSPERWKDGVIRCIPSGDDAVYTDAACTDVVGRARVDHRPTHFVAHEVIDGNWVATRVFRAGPITATLGSYYHRWEGECLGPFPGDPDLLDHEVTVEVDGASLMPLRDDQLDGDRLALKLLVSDDGARVPVGLRDRALDLPCQPTTDADGAVRCHPQGAVRTAYFADPLCARPVVVVDDVAPAPKALEVIDADGCASYRAIGDEVTGPLYRWDGLTCRSALADPSVRVLAAERPLELVTFTRIVDDEPRRRLQRVLLDDGALRVVDDRLYDTATDGDCVPGDFDGTTRCVPEAIAQSFTLYASPHCALPTPVVRLPQPLCGRPRFARTTPDSPVLGLQAIGDPVLDTLYQVGPGTCTPYTPPAGSVLHSLGPVLAPSLFVGSVLFGER